MIDCKITFRRRSDAVNTRPKNNFPGLRCAGINQDTMNHAMLVCLMGPCYAVMPALSMKMMRETVSGLVTKPAELVLLGHIEQAEDSHVDR